MTGAAAQVSTGPSPGRRPWAEPEPSSPGAAPYGQRMKRLLLSVSLNFCTDGLCGIPWCKWGKLPVMSTGGVVIRHHELAYGGNVHIRDVLTCLLSYEICAKKKGSKLGGTSISRPVATTPATTSRPVVTLANGGRIHCGRTSHQSHAMHEEPSPSQKTQVILYLVSSLHTPARCGIGRITLSGGRRLAYRCRPVTTAWTTRGSGNRRIGYGVRVTNSTSPRCMIDVNRTQVGATEG